MRKLSYLFLLLISVCFVSCNKSRKAAFLSDDLCFWEAKGPVKMIVYAHGAEYFFDEKGNLVQVHDNKTVFDKKQLNEEDDYYYTRNEDGLINGLYALGSTTEYKWKNGHVVSEKGDYPDMTQDITYEYDDKENVSKLSFNITDKDSAKTQQFVIEYEYEDFDSCGNWLKRKCSSNGNSDYQYRYIEYYNK